MASCISKLQRLSSMPPALHPVVSMTADPWQFAKLLFWAFVAGFSERFFLETVNRFTNEGSKPAVK